MMKSDATKESRIAEDQSALCLMEDEVVMFLRAKGLRLDAQFSSHAEMDSDPITAGKFEQHLFSPGERAEKSASGKLALNRAGVRAPENSFSRMQLHARDLLAEPRVPSPAKEFDFGELGHDGNLRRAAGVSICTVC